MIRRGVVVLPTSACVCLPSRWRVNVGRNFLMKHRKSFITHVYSTSSPALVTVDMLNTRRRTHSSVEGTLCAPPGASAVSPSLFAGRQKFRTGNRRRGRRSWQERSRQGKSCLRHHTSSRRPTQGNITGDTRTTHEDRGDKDRGGKDRGDKCSKPNAA